jgi:hypothetical protein
MPRDAVATLNKRVFIMPTSYRFYNLGRGGHIIGDREIVECADDKEAIKKAMLKADHFDVEIWDENRLVARLPSSLPKEFDLG